MKPFTFSGKLQLFPQEGGWYYVAAPLRVSKPLQEFAERGLIAIEATVGSTTWPTSLLPMGDGTHFIAINAKVRKSQNLALGDKVQIAFTLRRL